MSTNATVSRVGEVCPERLRHVAASWHGGQGSALYGLASTGRLRTAEDAAAAIGEIEYELDDLEIALLYQDRAITRISIAELSELRLWVNRIGGEL